MHCWESSVTGISQPPPSLTPICGAGSEPAPRALQSVILGSPTVPACSLAWPSQGAWLRTQLRPEVTHTAEGTWGGWQSLLFSICCTQGLVWPVPD